MRRQFRSIAIWILAAMVSGACTNNRSPAVATETVSPTPLLTATPVLSPTPTAVPPTPTIQSWAELIEPVAVGTQLSFDRWSPDSQTIIYWSHTQQDLGANPQVPPGDLHFLDIRTGRDCVYPDTYRGAGGRFGQHAWLSDGKLLVVEDQGQVVVTTPYGDDFTQQTQLFPEQIIEVAPSSPDRSWFLLRGEQAYWLYTPGTSTVQKVEGVPIGYRNGYSWSPQGSRVAITANGGSTYVIDARTGEVEQFIEWTHRGGLGSMPGAIWLSEDQFLISETVDQGPLLVEVGKQPRLVGPELFKVGLESASMASAATVEGTGDFHIVLWWPEPHNQRVLLYHSETGEVEELDFSDVWSGFSPDGHWLALSRRPLKDGYETYEVWVRPVDPTGSQARLIWASDDPYMSWSPTWDKLAKSSTGGLAILSIPEAQRLGLWDNEVYTIYPMSWSPDSRYVAALGSLPGSSNNALFIILAKP